MFVEVLLVEFACPSAHLAKQQLWPRPCFPRFSMGSRQRKFSHASMVGFNSKY